ncbi:hypothetical protein [Mesorhizobium sp. M4A.F.Ca.ET.022.05.2.1]|uniref:DUF768 domain-containing protein n=1 Tax=Mesorhizobium sp. M4A.F.Ca.ET.022.05.2.1 TaxID=2496653 RepID=UPI0026CE317A
MSTRGINFLHKWISNNISETVGADIISVAELTQQLFADAKAIGIDSTERKKSGASMR